MRAEALRQWRRLERRRFLVISGAVAAFLLLAIGTVLLVAGSGSHQFKRSEKAPGKATAATVRLNLPPPDLYRPITPEEAVKENAARSFSGRPDTPAAPFKLKTDASNGERALECMTQAVYYEAASEGAAGQRAVAQIVLNRMRHPGYPASVCGVIYQGSEKPIGCQFTFTCDGSLARIPVASLWKQARRIASEALAGKVFAPVGHATHYHADYVLPYWADSLDKSIQIGRHIFYRFKSGLGASNAFRQRYAGVEPTPPSPTTVAVSIEAVQNSGKLLSAPVQEDPLQVSAGELIAGSQPKPELAADTLQGTLIIDGDAAPVASSRDRKTEACANGADNKQLRPLEANDVRAKSPKTSC
jgi:spore germination cell wall hydrolase CwlJ-like protein